MRQELAEILRQGRTERIKHSRGGRTRVTHAIDVPPGREYTGEQVAEDGFED